MTGKERIIKTLKRERTDRVPCFEWEIDKKVTEVLSPGKSTAEFIISEGLDAICVDLNYRSEAIGEGLYRDEWGIVKKDTGEAHTFPLYGPIRVPSDLTAYIPPDPGEPERYRTLGETLAKYGHSAAVILHLNDVWSIPSRLMRFEDFIMNIIDEPAFISDIVNMAVDVNIGMAKEAARRGVEIIYTGDDYAYNSGPMCSPQHFREIFAKPLKRCVSAYKELGLYVIKHTDGFIMPILDYILDAGFDCLDPIDPIAGMSLAYMKKTFGERIALKGNVDCARTLAMGIEEETRVETRRCLEIGAPGGGYILSSSNTIHSSVRPENYAAMLETWREYGNYS